MRVVVYPADVYGCGHYRTIWPAQALAQQGHDVTIMRPGDRGKFEAVVQGDRILRVNGIPDGTDVVVLQRVAHRTMAAAIPVIRRQGIAVVVDQDDDLGAVHPSNPAHQGLHPRGGVASRAQVRGAKRQARRDNRRLIEPRTDFSWDTAAQACRDATLVTVSTPALAATYGRFGQARVLRNCIPEDFLWVPHRDSDVVGYAGSMHSHPDDVPELGFSIRQLVDDGGRFRVVGPGDGFAQALGLDGEVDATGDVPFSMWPSKVAELGVGVVPLADTAFNSKKSALKGLEYAACGVPFVASPRDEYRWLHERHGVGLLARRPRDWYRHLRALIDNPGLREDMSGRGREVAEQMTYERQAHLWAEAWADAVAIQRGTAAA